MGGERRGGAPEQVVRVRGVRLLDQAREVTGTGTRLILLDPCFDLTFLPSKTGRCSVRVLERPTVTGDVRGQFDDVIWVQVARALVQMYTMNALEQSVNAPIAMPKLRNGQ